MYIYIVFNNAQVLKSLSNSSYAWIIQVSVGFFICSFSKKLSFSLFFINIDISNISFENCCIAVSRHQIAVSFKRYDLIQKLPTTTSSVRSH